MSIHPAFNPISAELRELDSLIQTRLESDVYLVRSVAQHIVSSGGKRLRPALLLLGAGACGYRGKGHLELAAVVEFIHTATLLHDDVVDDSQMRRGRRTANTEFGNPASVLVGDFLYSRAFQMMASTGNLRVMEVLADATNTIAAGEVMQLMNIHRRDISEEQYFEIIRRKTSTLFGASARLGGILAGAPRVVEEGLARFGSHLGTAFQLIDDVLDYSGEFHEIGKNIGDDLNEGKATLPLIFVLMRGTARQKEVVGAAIDQGGLGSLDEVCDAIVESGAIDYVRATAKREAGSAIDAISRLPESDFKLSLIELCSFAVERTH